MTLEQIEEAQQLFEMYDRDSSGSIDNHELIDVLRLLGEDPTAESVAQQIAEVDLNQNGDLTLNEFLTIYERVVSAQTTPFRRSVSAQTTAWHLPSQCAAHPAH